QQVFQTGLDSIIPMALLLVPGGSIDAMMDIKTSERLQEVGVAEGVYSREQIDADLASIREAIGGQAGREQELAREMGLVPPEEPQIAPEAAVVEPEVPGEAEIAEEAPAEPVTAPEIPVTEPEAQPPVLPERVAGEEPTPVEAELTPEEPVSPEIAVPGVGLGLPVVEQKRVSVTGEPIEAHYEKTTGEIEVSEEFKSLSAGRQENVLRHEEGHYLMRLLPWADHAAIKERYEDLPTAEKEIVQLTTGAHGTSEWLEWFAREYADFTGERGDLVAPENRALIEKALAQHREAPGQKLPEPTGIAPIRRAAPVDRKKLREKLAERAAAETEPVGMAPPPLPPPTPEETAPVAGQPAPREVAPADVPRTLPEAPEATGPIVTAAAGAERAIAAIAQTKIGKKFVRPRRTLEKSAAGRTAIDLTERIVTKGAQTEYSHTRHMEIARQGLTFADRRWLGKNFKDVYEAGESMPSERIQRFADAWTEVHNSIGKMAEDLGVQVQDSRVLAKVKVDAIAQILGTTEAEILTTRQNLSAAKLAAILDVPPERITERLKGGERGVNLRQLVREIRRVTGADIGIDQIRARGGLRPFKRRIENYYPRMWTQDAREALEKQEGPLFDAIVAETSRLGIDISVIAASQD
ncbi:hypothetical protein LCGC14_2175190, partial [marine sediment metagenome]